MGVPPHPTPPGLKLTNSGGPLDNYTAAPDRAPLINSSRGVRSEAPDVKRLYPQATGQSTTTTTTTKAYKVWFSYSDNCTLFSLWSQQSSILSQCRGFFFYKWPARISRHKNVASNFRLPLLTTHYSKRLSTRSACGVTLSVIISLVTTQGIFVPCYL